MTKTDIGMKRRSIVSVIMAVAVLLESLTFAMAHKTETVSRAAHDDLRGAQVLLAGCLLRYWMKPDWQQWSEHVSSIMVSFTEMEVSCRLLASNSGCPLTEAQRKRLLELTEQSIDAGKTIGTIEPTLAPYNDQFMAVFNEPQRRLLEKYTDEVSDKAWEIHWQIHQERGTMIEMVKQYVSDTIESLSATPTGTPDGS